MDVAQTRTRLEQAALVNASIGDALARRRREATSQVGPHLTDEELDYLVRWQTQLERRSVVVVGDGRSSERLVLAAIRLSLRARGSATFVVNDKNVRQQWWGVLSSSFGESKVRSEFGVKYGVHAHGKPIVLGAHSTLAMKPMFFEASRTPRLLIAVDVFSAMFAERVTRLSRLHDWLLSVSVDHVYPGLIADLGGLERLGLPHEA